MKLKSPQRPRMTRVLLGAKKPGPEGTKTSPQSWEARVVHQNRSAAMDKDRVAGSAKQIKGNIKEAAGKVTGDAKLKASGQADKAVGKIQNTVGSLKDTMRGK
jgi:uncharacterized protein YjbJ (UPF0337 family)